MSKNSRFAIARLALPLPIALAACASPPSAPPDAAAHRAAWIERSRAPAADAAFDPSDGVSLDEAEAIALLYNPALREARARLEVARAGAEFAGLPPDPSLNLSVQRVLDMSLEPWIVAVQPALSVPAILLARREKPIARARLSAETWGAAALELETLRALRRLWVEWSADEARASAIREELARLDELLAVARVLGDADELRRADVRLFEIEKAHLGVELHHFVHEAEERRALVLGTAGLRPDAPLDLRPEPAPFADIAEPDAEVLLAHPAVLAAERAWEEAKAKLEYERSSRRAWIDVAPTYERDEGADKIGPDISLRLPLWNRNRRAIAEAEAEVEAARVAFEAEIERLEGELASALRRRHAASEDLRLLTETLAPPSDEQVREARALAELGDFDALLVLEAWKRAHETRLAVLDARMEIALAESDLASLIHDGTTATKENAE